MIQLCLRVIYILGSIRRQKCANTPKRYTTDRNLLLFENVSYKPSKRKLILVKINFTKHVKFFLILIVYIATNLDLVSFFLKEQIHSVFGSFVTPFEERQFTVLTLTFILNYIEFKC